MKIQKFKNVPLSGNALVVEDDQSIELSGNIGIGKTKTSYCFNGNGSIALGDLYIRTDDEGKKCAQAGKMTPRQIDEGLLSTYTYYTVSEHGYVKREFENNGTFQYISWHNKHWIQLPNPFSLEKAADFPEDKKLSADQINSLDKDTLVENDTYFILTSATGNNVISDLLEVYPGMDIYTKSSIRDWIIADSKSIVNGNGSLAIANGIAVGNKSFAHGGGYAKGNYSASYGYGAISEDDWTISFNSGKAYSTGNAGNIAAGVDCVSFGQGTFATGYRTIARGQVAHSEGYYTRAIASWTHAEGRRSEALGKYSHAEGISCVTEGDTSHAEGFHTCAKETASHSEGKYSTANGIYSHAEGNDCHTSCDCSHAEGYLTYAYASSSHAEGSQTSALGNYCHAEGLQCEASGSSSHAEGYKSKTSATCSHASGRQAIAKHKYSFVWSGKQDGKDYESKSLGSFCVSPDGNEPAKNFYIGDKTLVEIIQQYSGGSQQEIAELKEQIVQLTSQVTSLQGQLNTIENTTNEIVDND